MDKLRDEAVKIYDKYLNQVLGSPKNIVKFSGIVPAHNLYTALESKIINCQNNKLEWDKNYGGIMKRWDRHKSKSQRYVVGYNLFDDLVNAIRQALFNTCTVAEFISNPRATPLSGMTEDDLERENGNMLARATSLRPFRFTQWVNHMRLYGPLVVFNKLHTLVVTGYIRRSESLIYHDPWKGPGKVVPYAGFFHTLDPNIYCIEPELIAANQRAELGLADLP